MSVLDKWLITAFVLILLSIGYRNGYLEGRESVYRDQLAMPADGTCYVPGGCNDDRNTKTTKRH